MGCAPSSSSPPTSATRTASGTGPYREDEPMGGHDPYSSSQGARRSWSTSAYRRSFFSGARRATCHRPRRQCDRRRRLARDRLIPDLMRAALAGGAVQIRNPAPRAPGSTCSTRSRLPRASRRRLWDDSAGGDAPGTSGPRQEDARPVGWIVERLADLWPGGLTWEHDAGDQPHEAHYLKVDSRACPRSARLGAALEPRAHARIDRRMVRRPSRRRRHSRCRRSPSSRPSTPRRGR